MKRIISVILGCIVAGGNLSAQSLAEAARREAERRRQLEEQGIEAKVIVGGRSKGVGGNVTTFTRAPEARDLPAKLNELRGRIPANTYRRLLQKLDREIAECEERQAGLKRQADAEKWSIPRVGRTGLRTGAQTTAEKLRKQAAELEAKAKRLRLQRMETYEAGKKAGYLPGELDGKGIIP